MAGAELSTAPESLPGLPHGRAWVWQTYGCECDACDYSRREHAYLDNRDEEIAQPPVEHRPLADHVCRWRRTRRGEFVVEGPPSVVQAGRRVRVASRAGNQQIVELVAVGTTFFTPRGAQRYGYVDDD
jgi:hypothetical protein